MPMKTSLLILLLFFSALCYGQSNDFSTQFKADSLGTNGFRRKAFYLDTVMHIVWINGLNLIGYKKEKVLDLIGRPNYMNGGKHGIVESWTYTIYNADSNIYMNIDFAKNKVKKVRSYGIEARWNDNVSIVYESHTYSPVPEPKIAIIKLAGFPMIWYKIKEKDTIKAWVIDSMLMVAGVPFSQYIADSVKYPEVEKEAEITGTVYLSFVLEKDGSITSVKILRGIPGGPGIDKEARRVITSLPKLKPHMEKGHAVKVIYAVPIRFVLK
jgi:TonB family protein